MERVEKSEMILTKVSDFNEKDCMNIKFEIEKRLIKQTYEEKIRELSVQNKCQASRLESMGQ